VSNATLLARGFSLFFLSFLPPRFASYEPKKTIIRKPITHTCLTLHSIISIYFPAEMIALDSAGLDAKVKSQALPRPFLPD
jgi:hypothetical protein